MSEQTRRIQEQFGGSAAAYVASAGHAGGDDLETLLAWGRALRPARVLDVATGGGHTALAFAGVARRVTAYDLTEPMLRVARAFLRERGVDGAAFAAGDVAALPFREGVFDLVTCRIAAHHFADVAAAVGEMARVSRRLVVIEDTLFADERLEEAERLRDPTHVRSLSEDEWRDLVAAAGLAVDRVERFPKHHPLAAWLAAAGCDGEAAARVRDLLTGRVDGDPPVYHDTKLVMRARRPA